MKINFNEIIDPTKGHITVSADTKGYRHACFDLRDLLRVESLLVDKSAAGALRMAERLCGLCPVAHYLAGTRALDDLVGVRAKSYAEMVRRLLHYGSMIEAHSLYFIAVDREAGITLKQFSKQILTGAGSLGHFPDTATPGGAQIGSKLEDLRVVTDGLETAYTAAQRVVVALQNQGRGTQVQTEMPFADMALIDDSGYPDVFGTRVRIAHSGETLEDFGFSRRSEKIAEEIPGSPTPRPYIITFGKKMDRYQVGPVAQLSVGKIFTSRTASLRAQWLPAPPDAALARAIISSHVLGLSGEIISQLMKMGENYHLDE